MNEKLTKLQKLYNLPVQELAGIFGLSFLTICSEIVAKDGQIATLIEALHGKDAALFKNVYAPILYPFLAAYSILFKKVCLFLVDEIRFRNWIIHS